jgi:uncharacterized protein YuzE
MRLEWQEVTTRVTVPVDPDAPGTNPFRVTFDPHADAAYVRLANFRPGDAATQLFVEGVPNRADVIVDFSPEGKLLGVEVIGARAVLSPDLLALAEPPPENDLGVRRGDQI